MSWDPGTQQRQQANTLADNILVRTIVATVAQLFDLAANPIEIVPAPGAGLTILPVALIARGAGGIGYDFLPICAFDGDAGLGGCFDTSAAFGFEAPFAWLMPLQPCGLLEDAPILLGVNGLDATTGDYDIEFTVYYRIIPI